MAGDDFLLGDVYAENLAYAGRHVAVAGAVEAVSAHAVLLVEAVGEGVHIRFGRHGLMESGVEHTHLLDAGENLLHGLDAGDVGRIVERSEVVAVLDLLKHLVGKEHALAELLGAVDHAMAYGINLVVGLDATHFGIGEDVEHSLHGTLVVDEAQLLNGFRAVGEFVFEESVGETDFFHTTFGHDVFALGVNEFVFYRTAAAVENENLHCISVDCKVISREWPGWRS